MLELGLRFPDPATVVVGLNEDGTIDEAEPQPFHGPLSPAEQQDLHWYLEVYPAHYMTEIDDERAVQIAAKLPDWGERLFNTVFAARGAARLFDRFQDRTEPGRLITVSTMHPSVLAQPWELLKDPEGTYLFLDDPRISVRRRLSGAGGGRRAFQPRPKDGLHLLFVVSRPLDASFIDPRADPNAAMDALEEHAPGRVTVEFLRPATLDTLIKRLEDEDQPPVDILHFDGHGAYDAEGRLADATKQKMLSAGYADWLRDAGETAVRQQGFLLFEKEDGTSDLVPAALLGEMLNRKRIGLVVLSACQSAMIGSEDAMGSVAARLTDAGLPAVLAMTHSVLVQTTRALFGEFYEQLAGGRLVGTSLDNARRALYAHPERGERRRGTGFTTLRLQDWFLPALYQAGQDSALLTRSATTPAAPPAASPAGSGLPELQESGFWGRRRSLWDIERWFVGGTRRLVVYGFGGEGKTYLAAEAGRWLTRTGLFSQVCFVDYKSFQGVDARGYAVSTLSSALGHNLIDATAATAVLAATPTLLILDNLEALYPNPEEPPPEAARELLDAACAWSEAGASRVLVTTRQPDLHHPDWPTRGSNRCRYRKLGGLQPDDALAWFQALMALPPEPRVSPPARDALVTLFEKVDFHPLSIGVLAEVLKLQRIAEVGERLEAILKDERNPLVASLNLSIERLDPTLRAHLPSLGVFQGGVIDEMVTWVTPLSAEQWATLRTSLEQIGLIHAMPIPAHWACYLRFHPTLAPALWGQLGTDERATLLARHLKTYYAVSIQLYHGVTENPEAVRTIAWYELPNFMAAAEAAIGAGDEYAADFADNVGTFLSWFGMARDRADLAERAQAVAGSKGSKAWFAARLLRGGQLFDAGRYPEAETVYSELLDSPGETAGFNRFVVLRALANCRRLRGRSDQAEELQQRALSEIEKLEQTIQIRRLVGFLYADLGDTLESRGELPRARSAHERALAIAQEQGNQLAVRVSLSALSRIAYQRNDFPEAEKLLEQARVVQLALKNPARSAEDWYELGRLHARTSAWEKAEKAFREAANFSERTGNARKVVICWNALATVLADAGRLPEAESWYRKIRDACRAAGEPYLESSSLHNLAHLLSRCPGRLAEARHFAKQALAMRKTLDPATIEIWKSYDLLAKIAAAEGNSAEAREFRSQHRRAFLDAPSSRAELQRYPVLIPATFLAAGDPCMRLALEGWLDEVAANGRERLVAAIRRLLDGERDEDDLTAGLNEQESLIVAFVLLALADPAVLSWLWVDVAPEDQGDWERLVQRLGYNPLLPMLNALACAALHQDLRLHLDQILTFWRQHGQVNLANAAERLLGGNRNADEICAGLAPYDSIIIRILLAAVENPDFRHALFGRAETG